MKGKAKDSLVKKAVQRVQQCATEVMLAADSSLLSGSLPKTSEDLRIATSALSSICGNAQGMVQLREGVAAFLSLASEVDSGHREMTELDTPLHLVIRLASVIDANKPAQLGLNGPQRNDSGVALYAQAVLEASDHLLQEYRRFVLFLREMSYDEDITADQYAERCRTLQKKLKELDVAEGRTGIDMLEQFDSCSKSVEDAIKISKAYKRSNFDPVYQEKLKTLDARLEKRVSQIKRLCQGQILSPRSSAASPRVSQSSPRSPRRSGDSSLSPRVSRTSGSSPRSRTSASAVSPRTSQAASKKSASPRTSRATADTKAKTKGASAAPPSINIGAVEATSGKSEVLSPRPRMGEGGKGPQLVAGKKLTVTEQEAKLHDALKAQKALSPRKQQDEEGHHVHAKSPRSPKGDKNDPARAYKRALKGEDKAKYNTLVRDGRILEGQELWDKAQFTYSLALEMCPPGSNPKMEKKIRHLQRKIELQEEGIL